MKTALHIFDGGKACAAGSALFAANDAAIEADAHEEARSIVAEREAFYREVDASGMDEAARNYRALVRQIQAVDQGRML